MQEKSIINVLLHIRAEIIRDGLSGLDAVNELLSQRGINPDDLKVAKKIPRYFRNGQLIKGTLNALRQGPAPAKEVAQRMASKLDNVPAHAILATVHVSLSRLKAKGFVVNENDVWRLAQ